MIPPNPFTTVPELSKALAKAIGRRQWRIDKAVSHEDLLPHIERVEAICSMAKEYLKELMF